MYKHILVPIDGSDAAALGFNEAIKLASNQGAELRLVHVVDDLPVTSPYIFNQPPGKLVEILREDGRALLDIAQITARNAGVKADSVLVEAMGGQAGEHIVRQAKEWQTDLIVCGTHGRRGIRRALMGSDAEYIVRHAHVPVLLVRTPSRSE